MKLIDNLKKKVHSMLYYETESEPEKPKRVERTSVRLVGTEQYKASINAFIKEEAYQGNMVDNDEYARVIPGHMFGIIYKYLPTAISFYADYADKNETRIEVQIYHYGERTMFTVGFVPDEAFLQVQDALIHNKSENIHPLVYVHGGEWKTDGKDEEIIRGKDDYWFDISWDNYQ